MIDVCARTACPGLDICHDTFHCASSQVTRVTEHRRIELITRRDEIKASLRARDVWEQQVLRGSVPQCRVCGCTDDDCYDCYVRTGAPCCWVEPDLCSACAGESA